MDMCMSDLLTVAEYSKARNCSVSAVYKRLKSPSNNIHNFKVIIDGTTYLKREILVAEGLISQDQPVIEPDENPSTTSNETVEKVEEKVEEHLAVIAIRSLEDQLAQKNREIEDLNRRLEESLKHEREMTDKMADLLAQANELQRNNQILLAQAQQPKQIEAAPDPEVVEEPAPKKPWYKKLFGV
jgi:septal ring factor EnvC (AmiA/AmiB activator)